MPRYYAKQEVLDDSGKHVADRLTPACGSITMLERKMLRQRETFPLEEGQQFAARIYVYAAKRHSAAAHGVYEIVDGKLKRIRNSCHWNSFVDPKTMDRDHTYPSVVDPYQEAEAWVG
tara:strand:+ start:225 stop:578 length:354 start_codon:yes stop_codon:yes gene_type:complete